MDIHAAFPRDRGNRLQFFNPPAGTAAFVCGLFDL
jgi:hypothetical protein